MQKIVLRHGEFAAWECSTFFIEEGELELQFSLPSKEGKYFLVCGDKKAEIAKDGSVSIPVSVGTFRPAVKHVVNGRIVETFLIDPLDVKSVDGDVEASPVIGTLKRRISEQGKEIIAQKAEISRLGTALSRLEEDVGNAVKEEGGRREAAFRQLSCALLSFAWTDYRRNIYLDRRSLAFEAFLEAFGFEKEMFTEEELKFIMEERDI